MWTRIWYKENLLFAESQPQLFVQQQSSLVGLSRRREKSYSRLPGPQRETDEIEDDEGHGATMLSLKSHVKLKPVELSNITSAGKLLSRHPAFEQKQKLSTSKEYYFSNSIPLEWIIFIDIK